jgi:prepilin-type N-terminal cleavage/methylation domain-containing protein
MVADPRRAIEVTGPRDRVKDTMRFVKAFTLIEMLVVIAIIGFLAALLLSALSAAQGNARRTVCASNLKQINVAIRMYCDDSSDVCPRGDLPWLFYKKCLETNLALHGHSSSQDSIFACPADRFHYSDYGFPCTNFPQGMHEDRRYSYTSYFFNGFNINSNRGSNGPPLLGIAGRKFVSIKEPSRTLLVCEGPACFPYSWHRPKPIPGIGSVGIHPAFNDAMDVVSFVDGHANYSKMYWPGLDLAVSQDPPAGYDYKWSGD